MDADWPHHAGRRPRGTRRRRGAGCGECSGGRGCARCCGRPGRAGATAAGSDRRLVPRRRPGVLPRDLRRSSPPRHDLVDQHEPRAQHRRRQDLAAGRLGRPGHARRPSRPRVRSGRQEPHARRQRRRPVRDLRRRGDVPVFREPAGDAVLPRVGGHLEAVLQHLRRHAGQLVALRPVALVEPVGREDERLVHRRGRRRLPDAQRSGGSRDRLRDGAGRQPLTIRSPDRPVAQHPSTPRGRAGDQRRRRTAGRRSASGRRGCARCGGRRARCAGRRTRSGRRARPGRRRTRRRERRSRQLGRAVHHQPARAPAALLGEQLRLSLATIAATTGRASAPISRAT